MSFRIHKGLSLGLGLFEWGQLEDGPCLESLKEGSLDKRRRHLCSSLVHLINDQYSLIQSQEFISVRIRSILRPGGLHSEHTCMLVIALC